MGKMVSTHESLYTVADAIREKGGASLSVGATGTLQFPDGFVSAIESLGGFSTRVSGTIDDTEANRGITAIDIPIGSLSKIQVIYLRRYNVMFTYDQFVIDTLFTIISSDGLTKHVDMVTSRHEKDSTCSMFSNPNSDSRIEISDILFEDGFIRLISRDTVEVGYFHGTYHYDVIGY